MNIREILDITGGGEGSGCVGPTCGRRAEEPGSAYSRPHSTAHSYGYALQGEADETKVQTYIHPTGAKVVVRPNQSKAKGKLHTWKHYDSDGNLKGLGLGGHRLHDHLSKFHK